MGLRDNQRKGETMHLTKANLAIGALAAHDKARANITGVLVTAKETVATNGYVLAVVSVPLPDTDRGPDVTPLLDRCVLASESVATLTKLIATRSDMPPVYIDTAQTNANGAVIAQVSGTPVRVPKGEPADSFPDWQLVMPGGTPDATVHLSPTYLEQIAKLLRQGGSKILALEIRGDGMTPVVLRDATQGREQESTYLIMPMRP